MKWGIEEDAIQIVEEMDLHLGKFPVVCVFRINKAPRESLMMQESKDKYIEKILKLGDVSLIIDNTTTIKEIKETVNRFLARVSPNNTERLVIIYDENLF